MSVYDLNREQMTELKQSILCQELQPSYAELADADNIVSDDEVFEKFGSTEFTDDDFLCSCF